MIKRNYGVYDFVDDKTEYLVSFSYPNFDISLYFDSKFHKESFTNKLNSKIEYYSLNLSNKFHFTITCIIPTILCLYIQTMNKKGFCIEINNKLYKCLSDFQKDYKLEI